MADDVIVATEGGIREDESGLARSFAGTFHGIPGEYSTAPSGPCLTVPLPDNDGAHDIGAAEWSSIRSRPAARTRYYGVTRTPTICALRVLAEDHRARFNDDHLRQSGWHLCLAQALLWAWSCMKRVLDMSGPIVAEEAEYSGGLNAAAIYYTLKRPQEQMAPRANAVTGEFQATVGLTPTSVVTMRSGTRERPLQHRRRR